MSRPLTRKQYDRLRILGSGAELVSGGNQRDWKSLYDRGLVVGERGWHGMYINGVRITSSGLRALADYMDAAGMTTMTRVPE